MMDEKEKIEIKIEKALGIKVCEYTNGCKKSDLRYTHETLYRRKKGGYLLVGHGGTQSDHAYLIEDDDLEDDEKVRGGADVVVLSEDEGIEWLIEHEGVNMINDEFASDDEDDDIEEGLPFSFF